MLLVRSVVCRSILSHSSTTLVRLETDLWNRVDARVQQAHGFPLAWMEIMHLISTTPGCRVLDVAEALFITVGGASKVVDKVEGAGWCRRLPNPNDGRSNCWS